MGNVHVLFWFDVEDCTAPQSDDAAREIAMALSRHGVRGTFKIVGQKARTLEQRVRYRVVDELRKHDIGFHSNWHGLRPQIAEYMAGLDWRPRAPDVPVRDRPAAHMGCREPECPGTDRGHGGVELSRRAA